MKIAVIGSGGREHAILWRLARDSMVREMVCIPGNAGTTRVARSICCDQADIPAIRQIILKEKPDLVVVGPEAPLAAGLADILARDQILCFGPTAGAARIESSKAYAKQLMAKMDVPTADFQCFDDFDRLRRYVEQEPVGDGWVVKADGLAAGKGALVCDTKESTISAANDLLVKAVLGDAGRTVVLERRLLGREASALYWCDGESCCPLPSAQDYKRAFDGDDGPNTGGMGSYCPAAHLTAELQMRVSEGMILPILRALANDGHPYRGILYAGLMLTESGPQVIEFNCRFGDPETQAILPAWDGPFAQTMIDCAQGRLSVSTPTVAARSAVCIVLAADGYPGTYHKGIPLRFEEDTDCTLTFHAGTRATANGSESTGGRVLNAVGLGNSVPEAAHHAFALANQLKVPGLRFRTDIARDANT